MSLPSLRLLRSSHIPLRSTLQFQSRPIIRARLAPSVRCSSTSTATDARSLVTRLKNLLYGTSLTLFLALGYLYVTDTRANVHQWLVVPAIRWIYPDAEDAHHAGTKILKTLYSLGLNPRERPSNSNKADLSITIFGETLQNPVGTSAGIDKLAEIPDVLFAMGPAIVEVGGCTPRPQEGNPKPRVFRLPDLNSLINRYGLNGLGADHMAMQLRERVRLFAYKNGFGVGEEAERMVLDGEAGVPPGSLQKGKMMFVQVAKNKDTPGEDIDAVRRDYIYCVERVAPYADVIVVNVSSPNTPGLRALQKVDSLVEILDGVVGAANSISRKTKPKVMVKVSPDEDSDEQLEGIAEAVWKTGVAGVIVGNTTNRRTNVAQPGIPLTVKEQKILLETGGLSGPHMFPRTLDLVKRYRSLLDQGPPPVPEQKPEASGLIPSADEASHTIADKIESVKAALSGPSHERKVIVATGGITNGEQGLQILNAGADAFQIYTAMVYGGAGTVTRIKKEMAERIRGSK